MKPDMTSDADPEITYSDLPYLLSRLFATPVKQVDPVSLTWTWSGGSAALPTHMTPTPESAAWADKERLADAIAESLGVPGLPQRAKDELWDAVTSFFQGPPEDAP